MLSRNFLSKITLQKGALASNICANSHVLGVLAAVIQLATGGGHTCVLLNDSSILCWGANSDGQLGIANNQTDTPIPNSVDLSDIEGIASII